MATWARPRPATGHLGLLLDLLLSRPGGARLWAMALRAFRALALSGRGGGGGGADRSSGLLRNKAAKKPGGIIAACGRSRPRESRVTHKG